MLLGHEDKTELFRKIVERGNLRHAYLFFGDSGIGKSLFAKSLANFLERGEFAIHDVNLPLIDFLSISSLGSEKIGIEEIRAVKKFLYQTPLKSPRRFVLINDAEKLTSEAQSALLKIVEEPPEHGLIVFITYNPQALFPPLLSRLIKIYFRRARAEVIGNFLKKHGLDNLTAERLTVAAFGRIGRALELAEKKTAAKVNEEDLVAEIEDKIVDFWLKGPEKNSRKIAFLLEREALIKRYNLNQKLQRRAILEELANISKRSPILT
jgi:DNA polymerase-3 subunit delta'